MTTPDEGPLDLTEPTPAEALAEDLADEAVHRLRRLPGVSTVRAIALGIRDTAKDMIETGRRDARKAHDEAWEHYDELTKHRREHRDS